MRQLGTCSTIALGLAVAACGSGGAGGTTAADAQSNAAPESSTLAQRPDACSLVSAEEMAKIVGEPIVGAKAAEGSCTYETADAQASSVTVELGQGNAAQLMNIARRSAGLLGGMGAAAAEQGQAGQDVNTMLSDSGDTPKVGDEAFFGPNAQLSVRKGTSYIAVQPPIMRSRMGGGNPLLSADEKKAMALAIAERAVSRLP